MGKNIIICSDGTGNTFDDDITNVLDGLRRDNKICLHATAMNAHSIPKKIELEIRQTRSISR